MRFKPLILALLVMLAPLVALAQNAQNAQQDLNEQFWEAVRKGDVAAVTAFLDKGVDVNVKFRYGQTALFKAAERGHTDVVKLLLARGADVTVKDTFYGATAMTWALSNNHIGAVSALLQKDSSSVNEVLITGMREGNVELVKVALANGNAKPETLSAALVTALNDKDKVELAEMLKKAGAKPPLELDAATMQSYAGKYRPEQGNDITFLVKDGKLFAQPGTQQPFAMMAIDKTTLRPVAFEGLVVTFTVEGEKATGFTLKQGPNTTVFKRIEETKQP
ncbi:MAG TPA: ankyrin repeat domain-containing protein [Pyrinomonadaceae bacterium]|nr:ankyrin repeat domain-containing protein [Pyrinomonadaceae bacterium]